LKKKREKKIDRIKSKAAISVAMRETNPTNPNQLFSQLASRVPIRELHTTESKGIFAEADLEIAEKLIFDIDSLDQIYIGNESISERLFERRSLYRAHKGEGCSKLNFKHFHKNHIETLKTKRDTRYDGIYGFDWTIWYYLIPYLGQKPAIAYSRGPQPWGAELNLGIVDSTHWDEIFGINLLENGYSLFNHQLNDTAIAAHPKILGNSHISADSLASIVLSIIPADGSACGCFSYSYADFIYCLTIIREASKGDSSDTLNSYKLLEMLFENTYITSNLNKYGITGLLHGYYMAIIKKC